MKQRNRLYAMSMVVVMLAFGCATAATSEATDSSDTDTTTGSNVMRGLFIYMADAALFTDCSTGKRYPVAMEADYLALERAYLDSQHHPRTGNDCELSHRGGALDSLQPQRGRSSAP